MKNEFYKCGKCGAVIETVAACECPEGFFCCGEKMRKLTPGSSDGALEKHVPVVELKDGATVVKVGSLPHPMTQEHSIQWIEADEGKMRTRIYLNPGDSPEAFFPKKLEAGTVLRAYCNLHGLWEAVIG